MTRFPVRYRLEKRYGNNNKLVIHIYDTPGFGENRDLI